MRKEEIKDILKEALNIKRWAEKTNEIYTFIDEDEREEMVENILKYLDEKGYKISKKNN